MILAWILLPLSTHSQLCLEFIVKSYWVVNKFDDFKPFLQPEWLA